MAKYVGYKRPKDTKKTMKHFLTYLGHYKWAFFLVAILVFISAGAGICGTYLIKPLVNNFIVPGNMKGLLLAVIGMGVMYLCGALATLGYNLAESCERNPHGSVPAHTETPTEIF